MNGKLISIIFLIMSLSSNLALADNQCYKIFKGDSLNSGKISLNNKNDVPKPGSMEASLLDFRESLGAEVAQLISEIKNSMRSEDGFYKKEFVEVPRGAKIKGVFVQPKVVETLEIFGFKTTQVDMTYMVEKLVRYGDKEIVITIEIPYKDADVTTGSITMPNVSEIAKKNLANNQQNINASIRQYTALIKRISEKSVISESPYSREMGDEIKIQIQTGSKSWGFEDSKAKNTSWVKNLDINIPGGVLSFKELSRRFAYARDMYRHLKHTFDEHGIETRATTFSSIEMDIMRKQGLRNTEPVSFRIDEAGHWALYLNHILEALQVDKGTFDYMRTHVPVYKKIRHKDHDPKEDDEILKYGDDYILQNERS
ncbi:MAG: hypothetical protein HOO06_11970 [Bdellovibrionaceae bacterium]|jgi:hypothetical protein|nr:hypothetical protein [Pseudobdellovibrionaceae bacterium]